MAEVLREYGPRVVKGAMRRMIRDAREPSASASCASPTASGRSGSTWPASGAEDRSAHRFVTRLRKTGDQLVFTNEGTDPQFGSASSVYGTWRSASIVALSNFLGWDQLLCNAGALDHISLEPTPGTLTVREVPGRHHRAWAATTPASTSRATSISKMLMSGPEDLQRRANAAGGSAVVSFWFGAGPRPQRALHACRLPGDVVAGALGAFPHRDGVDIGGAWWWPNNPSGNVEEWEDAMPVLYLYRRERPAAAAPGGGAAATRSRRRSAAAQDGRDARADHQRRQRGQLRDRPGRRAARPPGRLPLRSGRDPGRASCAGGWLRRLGRRARAAHRRAAARVRQGPDDDAARRRLRRAVQRRRRLRRPAGARPAAGRRATSRRGRSCRPRAQRRTASCWRRTARSTRRRRRSARDRLRADRAADGRPASALRRRGSTPRALQGTIGGARRATGGTHGRRAALGVHGLRPGPRRHRRQLQGRRGAAASARRRRSTRRSTWIRRSSARTPYVIRQYLCPSCGAGPGDGAVPGRRPAGARRAHRRCRVTVIA